MKIHYNGRTQTILGKKEDTNRDLTFIIVKVGDQLGKDVLYIYDQDIIQDLVLHEHNSFFKKHDGVRPKNRLHLTARSI